MHYIPTSLRQHTRRCVLLTIAVCLILSFIVCGYVGYISQQYAINATLDRVAAGCLENEGIVIDGYLIHCEFTRMPDNSRVVVR